jgi:hypothetical protein
MASKRSLSWAVAFTGVVCASAMANVQITSDRGEDGVEEVLAAGQIVSVELRARCDADAPLLGADIELWCASDHVRIRDVAVNPTLGRALGQQKVALPARRVRLTRVQAPGNLITDFAVAGAADWLVRVQLEIMSDQPFRSGLEYRIRHGCVGSNCQSRIAGIRRSPACRCCPAANRQNSYQQSQTGSQSCKLLDNRRGRCFHGGCPYRGRAARECAHRNHHVRGALPDARGPSAVLHCVHCR